MTCSKGEKFEALLDIMARLRAPDGCPWDREQRPQDLKPYIVEEAYELVDALDGDDGSVVEESGDLLLQVVFLAQMATEEGRYDMGDVVDAISAKLVRRHPHVFGDTEVEGSGDVARNWERIKGEERRERKKKDTLLSGVPRSLPGLLRAHQLQERAAKVGFDWPSGDLDSVLDKVAEEIEELRRARRLGEGRERVEEELGDLFFALANLARHLGANAEVVVQKANGKFSSRFNYIEERVRATGRAWQDYSLEELEGLWQEAKEVSAEV
ncbi:MULTISPECIES: nucleoside triphosphate pyrophosphohydrolase [Synergistales]|uniref:nucleoside triphosphate pyrophosphohydrolase n=1 Tax=Synergistales TaxID=649776 RepID=UPI002367AB00|nr:nucleoside triphosphate pyrophosphohydrolase [Aminithiophilus ramosus]